MSNFKAIVKNPRGGAETEATYLEDHFGKNTYGVQIDGENTVYEESDVVYVRGVLDEPVLEDDWLNEQIAFYDFIWEIGTQLCGKHVNESLMKDFAEGGRSFEVLKAEIRRTFPTKESAVEAFKNPQAFYGTLPSVETGMLTEEAVKNLIDVLKNTNIDTVDGPCFQIGSYITLKEYLLSQNVIGAVEHARDPILMKSYLGMDIVMNSNLESNEIALVDRNGKIIRKWKIPMSD